MFHGLKKEKPWAISLACPRLIIYKDVIERYRQTPIKKLKKLKKPKFLPTSFIPILLPQISYLILTQHIEAGSYKSQEKINFIPI